MKTVIYTIGISFLTAIPIDYFASEILWSFFLTLTAALVCPFWYGKVRDWRIGISHIK